jgi:hypothetical protein
MAVYTNLKYFFLGYLGAWGQLVAYLMAPCNQPCNQLVQETWTALVREWQRPGQ